MNSVVLSLTIGYYRRENEEENRRDVMIRVETEVSRPESREVSSRRRGGSQYSTSAERMLRDKSDHIFVSLITHRGVIHVRVSEITLLEYHADRTLDMMPQNFNPFEDVPMASSCFAASFLANLQWKAQSSRTNDISSLNLAYLSSTSSPRRVVVLRPEDTWNVLN